MRTRAFILVMLILVSLNSNAVAQVVGTSNGKVEFIGLEKWTPRMIQEKLGYDSPDNFQVAIKVLAEHKEFQNRVAAAIILTNFADNDAAWLALMDGVRDENNFVNTACMQSLITLTKYVPRQVNWSPAASGIYHILNGTNLFALPHVIETLLKTKISPKLAKPLLKNDGGRMLLGYLRAKHEREKSLSHKLLALLSGRDFGFDDRRWAAWIASNR